MNGKKAAITVVSILVIAIILILIAFQVFFATYEPKKTMNEQSFEHVDEIMTTDLKI
ncbi:hypothetical protein [Ureibacillus acetophenoni]|uniref:Uncharacterized protein n=1 Tax=Ureibacillus acetophenoni TaxID=614649 RepID=A0A285UJA3_9BACL|nr:hypothetical protein [Ureibacillus acetophenoni]SOC41970.1 hypothetical protein SAMN05877842_11196 [Ureibacillus acetophenoni]